MHRHIFTLLLLIFCNVNGEVGNLFLTAVWNLNNTTCQITPELIAAGVLGVWPVCKASCGNITCGQSIWVENG